MERRSFVVGAVGFFTAGLAAGGRGAAGVPRIGLLFTGSPPPESSRAVEALRRGLRDLGYVEGRNITLEYRWAAEGTSDQLPALAAELVRLGVDVITMPSPFFSIHRARVAELALRSRLPVVSFETGLADAGGLLSYGPDIPRSFRRAAINVDRILKGAKPADLPVEQPTKFELVLNLEDREGPRADDPAVGPGAGGPGDRVTTGRSTRAVRE